jgi:LPXTG-motif cell wall-anchored protein
VIVNQPLDYIDQAAGMTSTGQATDSDGPDGLADDVMVVDIAHNAGFHLPLTGWNGTQTAIFVGVLALGLATLVIKSRRDAGKAAA